MQHRSRKLVTIACAALAGISITALTASQPQAQTTYKITVNKERLLNAQNEPQNWLMMNGDYGSQRYSKLTQINRDNVKDLRMVWALALSGMQNVGQNGPDNQVNPLIDNGFMYTSDGWGGVYKIDARQPNMGNFVWYNDLGVRKEGNIPRSRGIALWEDLVVTNTPDGRVVAVNRDSGEIVWDKRIAVTNEFGTKERLSAAPLIAEGKVLVANGVSTGLRGWLAALDARTGNELWRWYAVPAPGEPGSETWKDKNNAWRPAAAACGRPVPTIRRPSSRSGEPATRCRNTIRNRAPATTSIPTRPWRSTSIPASSSGISSMSRTNRGTTTRMASTCSMTRPSTARSARWSLTSAATACSIRSIATTAASLKAANM